jgi:hypothetical protein
MSKHVGKRQRSKTTWTRSQVTSMQGYVVAAACTDLYVYKILTR